MLSSNFPITPRPRPPAKMRRSSSQSRALADWPGRSPPPYAPFAPDTHPTLLGSPITATSQLIRLEEVCESEDKLQEKSKEELEELLRRASAIIKERERELDFTSETCKTLAENNASLKARNDTLISRLPPSQPSSPLASPSFQSRSFFSPAHSRASSRSLLLSTKPLPSPVLSGVRKRPGHARRVSSTPAELAALADQNAELLAKLADLDAEASRAEQAGKRRLRSLEAEIEGLRDELERAREESRKLEESMNAQPEQAFAGLPSGVDKQIVKMFKRLSREAKVRELKAKTRSWERDEQSEEPKNFAPNNLTPGLPFTSKIVSRKVSAPNLYVDTTLDRASNNNSLSSKVSLVESPFSSVPASATSNIAPTGPSAREQALVSQLLLKIRELEETNTQLATDHLKASIRLKEAQTESESVRMLCEFISDEVEGDVDLELEVVCDAEEFGDNATEGETTSEVHDNDPSGLRTESRKMIHLRSVARKASMDFGNGSTRHSIRLRKFRSVDSLPSLDASSSPPSTKIVPTYRNPKTRKTVLGLFEEDSSNESYAPPELHSFQDSRPFVRQLPSVCEPFENDISSDTQVDSDANVDAEGNSSSMKMISLGSELGLDLDEVGLRPAPGLGHVRTKSIMELLHSAEASSTPQLQSPLLPSPSTLRPPMLSDHQGSIRGPLRLKHKHKHAMKGKLTEEAVGYFPGDERVIYPRLRKTKSSAVFGSIGRSPAPPMPSFMNSPLAQRLGLDLPAQQSADSYPNSDTKKDQSNKTSLDKLRNLIFELWLWMYFAAIIVVFIFSVARKGPKVVLNKAAAGNKGSATSR
ncbi:hypothetical protein ACEPAI_6366 [Sanghuangporus weigelae]